MAYKYFFDLDPTFQKRLAGHEISVRHPLTMAVYWLLIALGVAAIVGVILHFAQLFPLGEVLLGLVLILVAVLLNLLAYTIFYHQEKKHLEADFDLSEAIEALYKGTNVNLAELLDLDATNLVLSIEKDISEITSKDILQKIIKFEEVQFIIKRMGTEVRKIQELANNEKVDIGGIVFEGLRIASTEKHHLITIGDIFAALCLEHEPLKRLLFELHLKEEDLLNIVYWQTQAFEKKEKKILDPENLRLTGGIGKDWAFGYTRYLNKLSHDVTAETQMRRFDLHRVGYDQEIGEVEKALVSSEGHNAILVGEPGIGKRTVVYAFAKRVYEGKTFNMLINRHVREIDIGRVLAGAKTAGEISGRLNVLLTETARAGNIILFIDKIESLFSGEEGKVGRVDASSIIMPYLESPSIFFIGTTTPGAYHKFIESKPALRDRFQQVKVEEPDDERVVRILEDVALVVEGKGKTVISYLAVKEIVKLSGRVYVQKTNPEKSIDLLDKVVVESASKGVKIVRESDVSDVVRARTGVEVGAIREEERSKLLNLEDYLHKRIIDQEEAVKAVSDAMRRSRAEVEESKKPIGSFLFLGPTGVGKTETSKALAESYFGSEKKMIRFDMSEYQTKESIYRLLGAEGVGGGLLSERISRNPHTLVLFDEIEKANPDILNLFLQLLDEGFISDTAGKRIVFSNTIIICTSNAGSEFIRQSVKSEKPYGEMKTDLLEKLQNEGIFRPEFINRFTAVVLFSPLSTEETREVAKLMIERLRGRLEKEKEIKLDITESAIAKLALKGYSPEFGARALRRTIMNSLENVLAKKMIAGEIKRGETVRIDRKDVED